MGKRANHEGSVYQRVSDGKWCASSTLADGRRKTVYGNSQREALARLRQLQQQITDGLALRPGREMTLGAYLTHWTTETLPARVQSGRLAPSTLASYRDQVRLYLVPDLGDTPLAQLSAPKLRKWLSVRQEQPGHRGKKLSTRSVIYLHAVLRAALSDAVRDELVVRNVCLLVEPPRGGGRSGEALSPTDVGKLLDKAIGHRLRPLWLLLLTLGLRKGEALALHWDDLDLEAGTVKVHRSLQRLRDADPDPITGRRRGRLVERQTTKTGDEAVLPLPAVLVTELEEHRRRQLKERLASAAWVNPELVFTTGVGTALEPRNVSRAWAAICDAAGVPAVRVHDMRHTTASLLLEQGVALKVVQQLLRHSRLSTTADIYAHVSTKMARDAADKMDEIFRGMPGGS